MKRVTLMMVMVLTAATVFAQWGTDVAQDMMTGRVTHYIFSEAQVTSGTIGEPFLMIIYTEGNGYGAVVNFGGYSIDRSTRSIDIRFGDDVEQMAVVVTSDRKGFMFRDPLALMSRMVNHDEVPMQTASATGRRMLAMWSMDGFDEAVAWLTGHVE